MNRQIESSSRRITVIIDPHIKAVKTYPVYNNGIEIMEVKVAGNLTNTFVLANEDNIFIGWCWPGNSAWVDFLNENA